MDKILDEIKQEREYQINKWGTQSDDLLNEPNDWVAFIAHHSSRWFNGSFAPYEHGTVERFRSEMIKVATLAVAAIESLDRQRDTHTKPFYQK